MEKRFGRREVLKSVVATGGAVVAAHLSSHVAFAQMPEPKLLHDSHLVFVSTTEEQPWQAGEVYEPAFDWTVLNLRVAEPVANATPMQGFGACFSELGWTSLSALSESDRDAVLRELFDPVAGARFTYCRTPIASSDFALDGYTYDEHKDDFSMAHFSIEHDRKTLLPFIHAAQKYQPALKLWASPWTPPTWMKRNHFYAEAKGLPAMGFTDNGIAPDQIGHEGEDMFIQKPEYFKAYAEYFGKYIDAYREAGIPVGMVMPQNEFNSAQNFPSCTWTPAGLSRFLEFLGPEMGRRQVEVFLGTLERPNPALVEQVMADASAARYIKGIGVQWAGKGALPALHVEYPKLMIFHSEQECGDGKNEWSYSSYCWQLMKHYFRSGASGYMYWNISLAKDARSTWGWKQNSLVTVDEAAKTHRFNHDYYVLKQLTHFVQVGAVRLDTSGTCDDVLAFRNPDGKVVTLLRNPSPREQRVQLQIAGREMMVKLPPDSLSTLSVSAG